jgi:hypothetical protein
MRRLLLAPSARGWAGITAGANVLSVFVTAVLVRLLLGTGSLLTQAAYVVAILLIIAINAVLTAKATSIREDRFPDHPEVVLAMIREVSSAVAEENALMDGTAPTSQKAIKSRAVQSLKIYLRSLEDVLAQAWSEQRFGGTTDVEVVLMNKAVDGFVTVGAWARKRPRSLDTRKVNPRFYDKTEAAVLYRKYDDAALRAPIHIVPDVSKHPDYDHFGRDPRIRTNSTILFPLYDRKSNLLGFVAVTARNRVGMFDESDRQFWNEVWELWEPHLVRSILFFQSTGSPIDEQVI